MASRNDALAGIPDSEFARFFTMYLQDKERLEKKIDSGFGRLETVFEKHGEDDKVEFKKLHDRLDYQDGQQVHQGKVIDTLLGDYDTRQMHQKQSADRKRTIQNNAYDILVKAAMGAAIVILATVLGFKSGFF
jgi:hypothetical protein